MQLQDNIPSPRMDSSSNKRTETQHVFNTNNASNMQRKERREIRRKKRLSIKLKNKKPKVFKSDVPTLQKNLKVISHQIMKDNNDYEKKLKPDLTKKSTHRHCDGCEHLTKGVKLNYENKPISSMSASTRQGEDHHSQDALTQKIIKKKIVKQQATRFQVEPDLNRPFIWPKLSKLSLPPLSSSTISQIKEQSFRFPINEECTSLSMPPSGRHVVAGFTDGTMRLFDTTGQFWSHKSKAKVKKGKSLDANEEMSDDFFYDLHSESDGGGFTSLSNKGRELSLLSKAHQNFGAVACQIHARGVITSLLMDVACTEDGLFAFGGVMRGSTELIAVDLSQVEIYHDRLQKNITGKKRKNILDLIKVYTFSDAKLKGFGACTRLKNGKQRIEYRLFTGKGIKNMHIWSFVPPYGDVKEPIWQCLYDTPTNGNTILQLHFRHDSHGLLQGISKSDDQKLRIWDLSYEQFNEKESGSEISSVIGQLAKKKLLEMRQSCGRPKRPPYVDVNLTENALGVCGSFLFSGGSGMYHKMGVMQLDVKDIQTPFNHTELALPTVNEKADDVWSTGSRRSSRSGRQQRGELISAVSVAGLNTHASHVVLELSDGSMVHYNQNGNQSSVALLSSNLYTPPHEVATVQGVPCGRKLCVSLLGSEGIPVLATSSFDAEIGCGSIILRKLPGIFAKGDQTPDGFWGFHGVRYFKKYNKTRKEPQSLKHISKELDSNTDQTEPIDINFSSKLKKHQKVRISRTNTGKSPLSKVDKCAKVPTTQLHKPEDNIKPCDHVKVARKKSENIEIDPISMKSTKIPKKHQKVRKSTTNSERFSNSKVKVFIKKPTKKLNVPKCVAKVSDPIMDATKKATKPININFTEKPEEYKKTGLATMNATKFPDSKVQVCAKESARQLKLEEDSNNPSDSTDASAKEHKLRLSKSACAQRMFDTVDTSNCLDYNASYEERLCVRSKQSIKSGFLKSACGEIETNELVKEKIPNVNKKTHYVSTPEKDVSTILNNNESTAIKAGKRLGEIEIQDGSYKKDLKSVKIMGNKSEIIKKLDLFDTPDSKKIRRNERMGCKSTQIRDSESTRSTTCLDSPPTSNVVAITSPSPDKNYRLATPSKTSFFNELGRETRVLATGVAVSPENLGVMPMELTPLKANEDEKGSIVKYLKLCDENGEMSIPGNRSKREGKSKYRKKIKTIKVTQQVSGKNLAKSKMTTSTGLYRDKSTDKEVGELLLSMKHQKRSLSVTKLELDNEHKRPKLVAETLNQVAASDLISNLPSALHQNRGTVFDFHDLLYKSSKTEEHIAKVHDTERRSMALNHFASHERLRNEILRSVERMMKDNTFKDDNKIHIKSTVGDRAQTWLNDTLQSYEEELRDMIEIQKMEASSLSAVQSMKGMGKRTPTLQISFPFPEVFAQARNIVLKYLEDLEIK